MPPRGSCGPHDPEIASPHGRVTLVLADHDPLVRKAVSEAIARGDDVAVVGEAANSADAISSVLEEQPDIVLLDAELPPGGGIAATMELLSVAPKLRVVLFSIHEEVGLALAGLEAGVVGFLSKDIDMGALARALRSVTRGEAAISRRLALDVIAQLSVTTVRMRRMRPLRSPLTDRQWEVIDLLAEGRTPPEIAEQLDVSVHTIRRHVRKVLHGLGAGTSVEAVQEAERLRTGRAPIKRIANSSAAYW
ncbi:MAG: response regulator [Solirubrobacteraceae bacterium]